jgi:hypothetical protein
MKIGIAIKHNINKDAQLEVQNLFAVVIHKFRFVFLGTPNYNREDVISKRNNILCQSTQVQKRRDVFFVISCHFFDFFS